MFNPHVNEVELANIKDSDLDVRIGDLTKKYQIAANLANNDLCYQIAVLVNQYKEEKLRRYERTNKTVRVNNKDQDLDDLIRKD